MPIADQSETELGRLAALIHATPGTELVRATPNQVVFCGGGRPRRTFDIRRDSAHGFRVTEIHGRQARHRTGARLAERTVIDQRQMSEWAAARLGEVRTSSLFPAGFSMPERSTLLMLLASAMITLWASTV